MSKASRLGRAVARKAAHAMHVVVCLGCGCDDLHACEDGHGAACHWVTVNHKKLIGICSECAVPLLRGVLEIESRAK